MFLKIPEFFSGIFFCFYPYLQPPNFFQKISLRLLYPLLNGRKTLILRGDTGGGGSRGGVYGYMCGKRCRTSGFPGVVDSNGFVGGQGGGNSCIIQLG